MEKSQLIFVVVGCIALYLILKNEWRKGQARLGKIKKDAELKKSWQTFFKEYLDGKHTGVILLPINQLQFYDISQKILFWQTQDRLYAGKCMLWDKPFDQWEVMDNYIILTIDENIILLEFQKEWAEWPDHDYMFSKINNSENNKIAYPEY
jgi:hypothetical protein